MSAPAEEVEARRLEWDAPAAESPAIEPGLIETWRAIPGWEGFYEASSAGRIRSLDRSVATTRPGYSTLNRRGVVLKPSLSAGGYMRVRLSRGGVSESWTVHVLVLMAFVGPRPEGLHACHADDDQLNNQPSNLRWDTPVANARDRVRNGHDGQACKTHCKRGHEFTPENTYRTKAGRDCQACRLWRTAESRKRRAA